MSASNSPVSPLGCEVTACQSGNEGGIALDAFEEEIEGFKAWAENGVSELALFAAQNLAQDKKSS